MTWCRASERKQRLGYYNQMNRLLPILYITDLSHWDMNSFTLNKWIEFFCFRLGLRFSVIRGWKSKKARESKAFHIEVRHSIAYNDQCRTSRSCQQKMVSEFQFVVPHSFHNKIIRGLRWDIQLQWLASQWYHLGLGMWCTRCFLITVIIITTDTLSLLSTPISTMDAENL